MISSCVNNENYYHNIQFETNGGSNCDSLLVLDNEMVDSLPSPSKEGYTFVGWYLDLELTVPFSYLSNINRNLKLYAKYEVTKFTVDVIVRGNIDKSYVFPYESKLNISTPVYNGYTFDGFFLDEAFCERVDLDNFLVTSNLALYTKWIVKDFDVKTVIDGVEDTTYQLSYGTKISTIFTPTKEHYTFDGWYFDKNYKNKCTINTVVNGNMSLFAKFIPEELDIQIIDDEIKDLTIFYDDTILILPFLEKVGYTFVGWYYDKDFLLPISGEDHFHEELCIYPKWEINYYTIDLYVDFEKIAVVSLPYGTMLSSVMRPSLEHYDFDGFYNDTMLEKYDDMMVITKDLKLYGTFKKCLYHIDLYIEDELQSFDVEYGTLFSSFSVEAKEGYKFLGLFENDVLLTDDAIVYQNTIIYAKFEIIKLNINLFVDGSLYNSFQVNYGMSISEITVSPKEHFNFDGWYLDGTYTSKYDNLYEIKDDLILYGKYDVIKVDVIIYSDDTILKSFSLNHGSLLNTSEIPLKFGHNLEGLYLDSVFTKKFDETLEITSNLSLYAKWEVIKQSVTIDVDGQVYSIKQIPYGTKITEIEKPMKENYQFLGFTNEQGIFYTEDDLVTKDLTIYTKFDLMDIYISVYDGDAFKQKITLKYGSLIKDVNVITKDGYTFKGYYYDQSFNNQCLETDVLTKNVNLYSKWKINYYTVTLNIEGTTSSMSLPYHTVIKDIAFSPKEHYNFSGWYFDQDFKQIVTNELLEKDLTIYGKYNIEMLKVTFYDHNQILTTKEIAYGSKIKNILNITKKGYTLENYYLDEACLTLFDQELVVTTNITVYTKWNINYYQVIIYLEKVFQEELTVPYETKISTFTKFTKENYDFSYFTEESYQTAYSENDIIENNTTLYGHFTRRKTNVIIYDGTQIFKTILLEEGSTINELNLEKTGYRLEGIYVDQALTTKINETVVKPNLILYSKWIINQYEINIYLDGKLEETLTKNYGTNLQTLNYQKDHYDFDGWYLDETYTKKISSTILTKNISLYGKFIPKKYTITLYDGEKIYEKVTLTYLDTTQKISIPKKTGHTFNNYYFDKTYDKVVPENYQITQNETFYLNFTKNSYKIKIYDEGKVLLETKLFYADEISKLLPIEKENYLFSGFYLDISLNKKIETTTLVTKDLTLYIKWTSTVNIPYIINYYQENLENNEYTLTDTKTYYGNYSEKIELTYLNYIGFTPINDANDYFVSLDGSTKINIYYARNLHTITYMYDDQIYQIDKCLYESTYQVLEDKLIEGYIFKGWFSDKTYTQKANLTKIKDQDEIIYAKVEKIISGTDGLEYELNEDLKSYKITGYVGNETEIIIPNGYLYYPITIIDKLINEKITKIEISENILTINDGAFKNNYNLKTVILPHSLEKIGKKVFANTLIENITLYENITSILSFTFHQTPNLKTIEVLNNPNYTSKDGVLYTSDLVTLLHLPANFQQETFTTDIKTKIIARCGMLNSKKIKTLNLTSIETIEIENIMNMEALQTITFNKEIIDINETILNNCPQLIKILVDVNNPAYTSVDGVLYNKEKTILIKYPSSKENLTYDVLDTTLVIKYKAFENPSYLEELNIKETECLEHLAITGNVKIMKETNIKEEK